MKKYAAIDIGTNSMRLLLAQVENEKIIHRKKEINPTRIGQSVDLEGNISKEAINRNLEAFSEFVEKARAFGSENIWAIATSALRDAKNGKDFLDFAYEKTGVPIEVISGKEEAYLGYLGVSIGSYNEEGKNMVIDIGGGSTEFIVGQGMTIEEIISEDVGAVRMTERIVNTDPITQENEENLKREILKILQRTLENLKEKKIQHFIGIGGTITTLAALHQELDPYDMDKVHGYVLSLDDIKRIKKQLTSLDLKGRRSLKGLHPKRADIIIAGVMILLILMEYLQIQRLKVSEYDNLEGLIFQRLRANK